MGLLNDIYERAKQADLYDQAMQMADARNRINSPNFRASPVFNIGRSNAGTVQPATNLPRSRQIMDRVTNNVRHQYNFARDQNAIRAQMGLGAPAAPKQNLLPKGNFNTTRGKVASADLEKIATHLQIVEAILNAR